MALMLSAVVLASLLEPWEIWDESLLGYTMLALL
jgi:hypothetical protein